MAGKYASHRQDCGVVRLQNVLDRIFTQFWGCAGPRWQSKVCWHTLAPFPLVAVYTASKTAIEGFTASLAHELQAFNVRVKLVEPG
jgi:NAD(P)-dependent dehydrogenase (short-subunit alcohol dehydrogenase family)